MAEPFTFKYLCWVGAKTTLLLSLVELTLRLLPASDGPYAIFDRIYRIPKYDNQRQAEGYATAGNLAQRKIRWHINNMGWNSARDYQTSGTKPVIAIIGNSYIEGMAVDLDKGLAERLQSRLGDHYECYGFGYSGARLGQYLNVSRYVHQVFHPKVMVFTLFDVDILGSIAPPGQKPQYFMFFQYTPNGIRETPIREFVPHWAIRTYGKLALVRYFSQNKQQSYSEQPLFAGDILLPNEKKKYQEITNYAFQRIQIENPGTSVVLVLDGPRRDIYRGPPLPRSLETRRIIKDTADRYGFHVVDLTRPMQERYQVDRVKFNFDDDYHWNSYGFQVVAEEMVDQLSRQKVVRLE